MDNNIKKTKDIAADLGGMVIGSAIYAGGMNLFIVPSGFYSGGIMGLCQIIRTLLYEPLNLGALGVDIAGIIYYLINIPLMVLMLVKLGKRHFFSTLVGVTLMTVFLTLIPVTHVIDDAMAASVVGGILSGIGIGLLLRVHSSGGGLDIIGLMLIKSRDNFSVGRVNMLVNLVIYLLCLFLYDVNIVIYSLIFACVSSIAMDRIHTQNINMVAHIITKKDPTPLEHTIMKDLYRGITRWESVGAYTEEKSHILFITLSKYEAGRLRAMVHEFDPDAFVVFNEGVSVVGHYLRKI